jgi:hypothetical protein
MQRSEQGIRLSASDLMRFAGCVQATAPDLARLKADGRGVVEILVNVLCALREAGAPLRLGDAA